MMKAKYQWALAAFCFVLGIIGLLQKNAAAAACFVAGAGIVIGLLSLRKWQRWTLLALLLVGGILLLRSETWQTYIYGGPFQLSWDVK